MNRINIIRADTAERAGCHAANIFEALIHEQPDCVIGLATGSTPLPLYRELIRREAERRIDFAKVTTFNLDEYRGMGPDHPQGYRRFMQENLFDHIGIKMENTFVPDGLAEDVEAMCAEYERAIEAHGGIDLQLLGIGHDGHIGFNEPGESFSRRTHEVELTAMTRRANARFFAREDEVPRSAITMGIGTIMSARSILLMVTGADKAEVLRRALREDVTPKVPASILQFHPNVTLVCDAAAAAALG